MCQAILPPDLFKHAEKFIDFIPDYESDADLEDDDSPLETEYKPDHSAQKSNLSENELSFPERFSKLELEENEPSNMSVEDEEDNGPILVQKAHVERILNK